jgi:hypothetical protein
MINSIVQDGELPSFYTAWVQIKDGLLRECSDVELMKWAKTLSLLSGDACLVSWPVGADRDLQSGLSSHSQNAMKSVARVAVALLVALALPAFALDCPRPPQQATSDWGAEVEAAVGRIGPAKGAELALKAQSTTRDLMGKLPQANTLYLEQMMYAAYCSALKDDKTLPEREKAALLRTYNSEVRQTIRAQSSTRLAPQSPKSSGASKKAPKETTEATPAAGTSSKANAALSSELARELTIRFTAKYLDRDNPHRTFERRVTVGEVFAMIAPYLVGSPHEDAVRTNLTKQLVEQAGVRDFSRSFTQFDSIDESTYVPVSIALRRLDLVKIEYLRTSTGSGALFWRETERGREVMFLIQSGAIPVRGFADAASTTPTTAQPTPQGNGS